MRPHRSSAPNRQIRYVYVGGCVPIWPRTLTSSAMNPIEKYLKLQNDVLAPKGTRLAFFKGSTQPDVVFVGEAPGPDENISGIPFVGRSGKLVEQTLTTVGLSSFRIAFLNPVFRMPTDGGGKFRKPTSEEVDYYRPMAQEIIDFLRARYTVLLGSTACEAILSKKKVSELRGEWVGSRLVTFHPGFVLRNPDAASIFESDIRSVVTRLESDRSNLSGEKLAPENHPQRHQKTMDSEKIKAISEKSESVGKELTLVKEYLTTDPNASIIKARKLLEMMLTEYLSCHPRTLSDQIKELAGKVPEHIESSMHFIRRNGNTAVHSSERLNSSFARQNFDVLLSLVCWFLSIDIDEVESKEKIESEVSCSPAPSKTVLVDAGTVPSNPSIRVRFFIADAVYKTWAKVAVLTDDGTLYSEYLAWMKPKVYKRVGLDFRTFEAKNFSFGGDEHGSEYQAIREVNYREATTLVLTQQANWVNRYLESKGIDPKTFS